MVDNDTITRLEWNPSPETLKAYLKREIEMARSNIDLLKARGYTVEGNTLHSTFVVSKAMD